LFFQNIHTGFIVSVFGQSIRKFFKSMNTPFFKFLITGVINTLVDFGVFFILFHIAGWAALPAHIAGFSMAVANSYFFNSRWTFKGERGNVVRFFVVAVVMLCLSSFFMVVFGWFASSITAKIITVLLSIMLSYWLNKIWVFGSR
jgi:putative flippase GtrA